MYIRTKFQSIVPPNSLVKLWVSKYVLRYKTKTVTYEALTKCIFKVMLDSYCFRDGGNVQKHS